MSDDDVIWQVCQYCKFSFCQREARDGLPAVYECRKHAPRPFPLFRFSKETNGPHDAWWPEVAAHDWCGEWKDIV